MDAVIGRYGGWVRGLSSRSWLCVQALLPVAGMALVALFAAAGGAFWFLAVIVTAASAALIVITSQTRVAAFPAHPQMLLALMHASAGATGHDFARVIGEKWSVDQTGKTSQVRVRIEPSPVIDIKLTGTTMVLPLDANSCVVVDADAALFVLGDEHFWQEVWSMWQPNFVRSN